MRVELTADRRATIRFMERVARGLARTSKMGNGVAVAKRYANRAAVLRSMLEEKDSGSPRGSADIEAPKAKADVAESGTSPLRAEAVQRLRAVAGEITAHGEEELERIDNNERCGYPYEWHTAEKVEKKYKPWADEIAAVADMLVGKADGERPPR
jgi:hypothetical protein